MTSYAQIRRLSIVSEDVSTLESYRIVAGLSSGSPALVRRPVSLVSLSRSFFLSFSLFIPFTMQYLWTPSDSEPLYHHITVDFNKENRLAFMKKVWAAHLLVAQCQRRMEESINACESLISSQYSHLTHLSLGSHRHWNSG